MKLDAHQHFWRYRAAEFDWLQGPLAALQRDFLPSDLAPLLAGFFNIPLLAGQLIGLLLGGAASLAAAFIPLGWVEKRVATLGES